VYCERTVRSGGASRHTGIQNRIQVISYLTKKSYENRPRKISGRAQDTNRGGPGKENCTERTKTWHAYGKYPVFFGQY